MNNIIFDNAYSIYWLSYRWLENNGIPKNTFDSWRKRAICDCSFIGNNVYINYDTIPEPSREKLPSKEELRKEYLRQRYSYEESYFLEELQAANNGLNVPKWVREIQAMEFPRYMQLEEIVKYARRASVYERAIELNREWHRLSSLLYAFNTIYPENGYTHPSRFKMALTKAEKEGILTVAIDRRVFAKRQKKYGELHEYSALFILNHNRAYDLEMSYEMFSEACQKLKIETPSFGWFRTFYRKNKNLLSENRDKKPKSSPIYASLIPTQHAGSRWEMDGWTIPIFAKKQNENRGKETFVRYTLFAIMDSHSRKIIGSFVAESENTESILEGLSIAVKNTGYLPREIVADNHAWNQTKIADNIKEKFEKLGVIWTIDSNPKRKSKLERSFRTLGDKHFKKCYGYIGQGIRSKIKNGIAQQELLDKYGKIENMLIYSQVVSIAVYVVGKYNDSKIKRLGDTPNNLYEKSERPHAIPVNEFSRISLFIKESETTIRNGQITLRRGVFETHEYQLPAEYYDSWNNKTVLYRRDKFDHIYLYDKETGDPICSLSQKVAIHEAISDQTERDKELLFKNSGRIKGIQAKSHTKKERYTEEANTINPDAYGLLNELTTPKDTLASVRRDYELRKLMTEDYGINPDDIPDLPKIDEMSDTSMRPKKKEKAHPFHDGSGTMEKFKISDLKPKGSAFM